MGKGMEDPTRRWAGFAIWCIHPYHLCYLVNLFNLAPWIDGKLGWIGRSNENRTGDSWHGNLASSSLQNWWAQKVQHSTSNTSCRPIHAPWWPKRKVQKLVPSCARRSVGFDEHVHLSTLDVTFVLRNVIARGDFVTWNVSYLFLSPMPYPHGIPVYIRPTFLMQFPKDLLRRRGRKGKKRNEGGENGKYIGPKRKRERRRRRIAKLDNSKEEGQLFFVLFSIWKKNRVLLYDRRTTLPTTLRTGRRVFSFKGDRNQSSILLSFSKKRVQVRSFLLPLKSSLFFFSSAGRSQKKFGWTTTKTVALPASAL